MSERKRWDSGPDCLTCRREGRPGIKRINVTHHSPEERGRSREVYGYDYYATGDIGGGPIPYHPFVPVSR